MTTPAYVFLVGEQPEHPSGHLIRCFSQYFPTLGWNPEGCHHQTTFVLLPDSGKESCDPSVFSHQKGISSSKSDEGELLGGGSFAFGGHSGPEILALAKSVAMALPATHQSCAFWLLQISM